MNVQVKHSGTAITGFVISYEREHKICTGIGNLQIVIDRTIPRTFDPWDSIDIYENGDFKVRYYISSIEDSIPAGTITLDCQDISKRLVDYFIPDSYTIDYPSYTRYWIEKFLTEVGIDFTFNTASQGNLISNNTQLGLTSAYEQILTLLQMSGWFIYFDGNQKAVIGPLDADLSINTRHLDKSDIININRISDDKMLRNRALVLGAYDPYTLSYASADVTVHTRWNYDSADVRAIVISNSNIPNKSSAFGIANQLIKEFARITIEKHIQAWGARDFNIGDAIRVNSNVWKGKGLVTTFGTSLSKNGLVSNIVLDERCPRLFGFFDFGDYVYVGTYGDGIWKKHLRFDPTWYDFSTGLTDPAITDLHINNGIFGSVAASGEMYRALEEGSWSQIVCTGLMSSIDDVVASGDPITYRSFSGLMARAVIVDKFTNNIKFGIDTYSGLNYGDYFLDNYGSGFMVGSGTGITTSGYLRSWIVEYDPFTGNPVGNLGSGIYPVSYSGNYTLAVIDLENDGYNDYISVASIGQGVFTDAGYDLGRYATSPKFDTFDSHGLVATPINSTLNVDRTTNGILNISNENALLLVDDAITGDRLEVNLSSDGSINRRKYSFDGAFINVDFVTKTFFASPTLFYVLSIHKMEFLTETYRVYYISSSWSVDKKIYYKDWDAIANTLGSQTTVYTSSFVDTHANFKTISLNGFTYFLYVTYVNPGTGGGHTLGQQSFALHLVKVNQESTAATLTDVYDFSTPVSDSGWYEYFPQNTNEQPVANVGGIDHTIYSIVQDGDFSIKILCWFEHGYYGYTWTEHSLVGGESGLSDTIVYQDTVHRFNGDVQPPAGSYKNSTQLTRSQALLVGRVGTTIGWYMNGSLFSTFTGSTPYYLNPSKIYPIYSRSINKYCAKDVSGNFHSCDAQSLVPQNQINFPVGYTANHPFSNTGEFGDQVFWAAKDVSNNTFLLKASSIEDAASASIITCDLNNYTGRRGITVGGFFVDMPDFAGAGNLANYTYFYYLAGELQFTTFMVLQREGSNFNLIEHEIYPIRVDISNQSPLLTVGSGENSFVSNYIYDTSLEQIIFTSGTLNTVEDYRYTYLETSFSGIGASTSGLGLQTMGLYVIGSGIYGGDVSTYSGGFQVLYTVPSGYGNRIETSNYGLGGQYVFITTSGDMPMFYQADPGTFGLISYSGLPESRATIIRLDDRI